MAFVLIIVVYGFPAAAMAYVGPGAALSLLGTGLGFSSLVVLGVVFTFAWPIWLIYKKIKKSNDDTDKE
jgi:uncharacterized membrane protein